MTVLENGEFDAVLNGNRIHYSVRGAGPVLIAHSGGPGFDARGWDELAGIDRLMTVVVIHPRGSGLSANAHDEAYGLSDFAHDLEALRLHLKLHAPVIMGWSHGGMVAQRFAALYPQSLSRLILVDTAARLGGFVGGVDDAVKRFKAEPWFDASYRALKREWEGDYRTDQDMAELWDDEVKFYFSRFDATALAYHERTRHLPVRIKSLAQFNALEAATMDLRPDLARIKVPALVIVGRDDFITTVDMAREIQETLEDAQLEIFEASGHFPFIEEPGKFLRTVAKFCGLAP
jgi:proline iminopeptidase